MRVQPTPYASRLTPWWWAEGSATVCDILDVNCDSAPWWAVCCAAQTARRLCSSASVAAVVFLLSSSCFSYWYPRSSAMNNFEGCKASHEAWVVSSPRRYEAWRFLQQFSNQACHSTWCQRGWSNHALRKSLTSWYCLNFSCRLDRSASYREHFASFSATLLMTQR